MKIRDQLYLVGLLSAAQFFFFGFISPAVGDEKVADLQFDSDMLWGTPADKASADLSRFSEGNPVPTGNMKVDLYLNGNLQKTTSIYFMPVVGKTSATACFTPADLMLAGIAADKLAEDVSKWIREEKNKSDCRVISSVVPEANAVFDFSEQRLDLTIPQAFLIERPKDYIDPKEWDRGITAGRLNYSLDMFRSTSGEKTDTQGYAYLESGFNALGWRIRNTSTVTSARARDKFQAQRTFAQTDVEPLKSTLTIGQYYTDGQLFNSYGLQGAFLETDTRMLPPSLRSYSPVVKGSANTNAKVTIRQGTVVIYERAVPPGPFEISNFQAVGYGNDLEVTITEADGSTKKFSVPFSPLVQLLRPDQSKYSASFGQAWTSGGGDYKPAVGQFNYQYGLNNYLTAMGGAIVSEDYSSIALGSAVSTYVGGVSADYTFSNNRLQSSGSGNGESVRLVYSTLFRPTQTNITISSYRFSSKGFWSFGDVVANENSRNTVGRSDDGYYSFSGAKQKSRFDISLRQRLAPGLGSVFLSGTTRNFWNRDGSDTQYQVSYGNRFKDLSYDLSASRVKDQNNRQYNEYRLSFSLPIFSPNNTRNYLSSTAWKNSNTGSQAQVQLGGTTGDDQQFTYGITTTQGLDNKNTQKNYGLNGTYQGAKAFVTGGVSKGAGYQQTQLGISGSVLAHSQGVTFGQTLGETVALVEAKDAEGARITNAVGAAVDSHGFGVVPYLTPYSRNRLEIDPEGLSSDIEFENTSSESVPVAGAIVMAKFDTSKERSAFINGTFEDGTPLPFGAEVVDSTSQKIIGYVGQGGRIFARGVDDHGQLLVKLKGSGCLLNYQFEPGNHQPNKNVIGAPSTTTASCKVK